MIDEIVELAYRQGALAAKVSGAGGGGFITLITNPENKYNLISALDKLDGRTIPFQFTEDGTHCWHIK
jgi:D-glycero-alpha-D-manno-heptose-7-phosphate kinase